MNSGINRYAIHQRLNYYGVKPGVNFERVEVTMGSVDEQL